jgi:hypothetical protein
LSEAPQPKIAAMLIVSGVMFGAMALCGGIVWLVGWAIHK